MEKLNNSVKEFKVYFKSKLLRSEKKDSKSNLFLALRENILFKSEMAIKS